MEFPHLVMGVAQNPKIPKWAFPITKNQPLIPIIGFHSHGGTAKMDGKMMVDFMENPIYEWKPYDGMGHGERLMVMPYDMAISLMIYG